jgi:hypothetical protein
VDEPDPVRRVDRERHVAHDARLVGSDILSRAAPSGAPSTYCMAMNGVAVERADLVDATDVLVVDARLGARLAQEDARRCAGSRRAGA